ncbi:MAG: hypothetical protein GY950_23010, partial [bacterium]|nr:hypothetical protein [bacterium]
MRILTNPGLTRQLLVFIILVQLFMYHLWGLDPNKTVDLYLVDYWEKISGLPSNSVRSITQTPDGYLWIGTNRGLVRFDGKTFVSVTLGEKEEVRSQEIANLFVDREEVLWIGRTVGLTYRSAKNRFRSFTRSDGITGDGIRRVKDDMKGNTWISFDSSYVNRFSNGQFTAFDVSHGLLGKKINAILEDRRGNLLFGTRENGIFIYKAGKFFKYPVPGLDNLIIITMHEDRNGDLWIGTDIGLLRVTGQESVRYTASGDGLSNDYITAIMEDSESNLWVGTQKGLNRIKRRQGGAADFESLLKSLPINCVFEDRENSLWIGTDGYGLRRLKDGKFMSYKPFDAHPEENPLSLFEDRHGDTWIGTVNGKLFRCRGQNLIESEAPRELSGTSIVAIAEDAEGNPWLGTTSKGVFQKKKNQFIPYTDEDGLADNNVTSIFRDSRGNLWFSTFDGVSVLRSRDGTIESLKSGKGLSGTRVHNVYESNTGDILIAANKGITVLKDGKIAEKSITHYLSGISVTCIYEDPAAPDAGGGVYWITTVGTGLKRLRIKDGTITSNTSYTTAHGMTSNFLYQFLEDSRDNFWLTSDRGILRVSKNELNRIADSGEGNVNCTSFGVSDGMKSLEFHNKSSRNSVLKAGNGEFRFITKKGISIMNPEKIRINTQPPSVVIEEVSFNRQSMSLPSDAEPFTLKGVTRLSIHFTVLTFLSPEKTKFKHRLEGGDGEPREWVSLLPGQGRVARYEELPPGTYTFRVTACNADGVWNRSGDSLTFTLKPFFYETFFFKIAMLLLFVFLAAAAFYIFKKKKPFPGKKAKYKGSHLNPHFAEECMKKLEYLVEVDKVYCDADISLQSLAGKMSMVPHQLSQLLNEKMDRNFADFINWNRIEEVKKILQTPGGARRKISVVAGEVGFNTMAA